MQTAIELFIAKARERGLSDEQIKQKMVKGGWDEDDIAEAFGEHDDLVVPPPPPWSKKASSPGRQEPGHPIAVVENLTPRGFEYRIFSLLLLVSLAGVIWLANIMISLQSADWEYAAFPLTMLIVTSPIAVFVFLRLRRAELAQPTLRKDPSRRRVIQAIELITFLAVIIHTIVLLYLLISGHYATQSAVCDASYYYRGGCGEENQPNFILDAIRWIVTLVLAGGTFAYYWRDEHRPTDEP